MTTRTNFTGNPGTTVVDACSNPADPNMAYILWSDGKISYKGNPPSLETSRPHWENLGTNLAKRIQIIDWATGRGWVFSIDGKIKSMNGAFNVTADGPNIGGNLWTDFSMNPDNSGKGYRLAKNGAIYEFGGATNPPAPLLNLNPPFAQRFWVDWTSTPPTYLVMHGSGSLYEIPGQDVRDAVRANNNGPFWPEDIARDLIVFDTAGAWRGYILDGHGGINPFWTPGSDSKPTDIESSLGVDWPNSDQARVLLMLDGTDRLAVVTNIGQFYDWQPVAAFYTVAISGPQGAQTTRTPTVTWTATAGSSSINPDRVQIKIFAQAQYLDPGFSTSLTPVYDSGIKNKFSTLSQPASMPLSSPIGNGTFKAYVRVGKLQNDGETIEWSPYDVGTTFNISGVPPIPTVITPANNSTVNTDIPTFGATLGAEAKGARVKGEWQLATDSGFTVEVRDLVEAQTDLRASGATVETLPSAMQLFQGSWFLRAREVDEFGDVSGWTTAQKIIVSHPPSTANWSPTGDQAREFGDTGDVPLDWDFSDPSPVDNQTAYQVVVETNTTTPTQIVDTGKTVSTASATTVTIPDTYKNIELRWRVRVYDSDDIVGPWSQNNIFRVMDLGDVTITSPTDVVTSPQPLITWTFAATGDRAAAAYRVRVTHIDGIATVVDYDSGQRQGAATSLQIDHPILTNTVTYKVEVTVWDSNGLSSMDSVDTTAAWTQPDAGTGVVLDATNYEQYGYISISWDATSPDSAFVEWRIYRRIVGDPLWTKVTSTLDSSYLDYAANSNENVEYAIVQVALRFGVSIESGYVGYQVFTTGTHYWLIYPEDATYNVRLSNVTDDGYTDEYERETLKIIGRGNKSDIGTHYGVNGQMTAELRDLLEDGGPTARQQKKNIEKLQALRARVFLRTPFGDVYPVVAGDIKVSRIAGAGVREFVNLSIPYQQVIQE